MKQFSVEVEVNGKRGYLIGWFESNQQASIVFNRYIATMGMGVRFVKR